MDLPPHCKHTHATWLACVTRYNLLLSEGEGSYFCLRQAIEGFALMVKKTAQTLQSFGTELAETELPREVQATTVLLSTHTDRKDQMKVATFSYYTHGSSCMIMRIVHVYYLCMWMSLCRRICWWLWVRAVGCWRASMSQLFETPTTT